MTALPTVFFGAGVLAAGGIAVTVLASITHWMQLWPPGEAPWKAALYWSLVGVVDVCLLALGFLQWNTWFLPRPASLAVGGVLPPWAPVCFSAPHGR